MSSIPPRPYSSAEWRTIRIIGAGGQGSATLVQHRRTGELAVRKKTHSYMTGGRNNMPIEPFIVQNILPRHRHITRMIHHEMGGDRGQDLILWFEYCRGGDLAHAVSAYGQLPEDFIWHCFIQIARALTVIHNEGSQPVCHRDLKPDNVFLTDRYVNRKPWPTLKLGDFGLATLEQRSEGLHAPAFQGPELPILTSAGDIWALGATIHWLVYRRAPLTPPPRDFPGTAEEWEEVPEARRPQPLPRSYSKKLSDYMMDCLERDPRHRPSSRMLLDALEYDRPRRRR